MWQGLLGHATGPLAQRTALMDALRVLTHAELNQRVDAFAAQLQDAGVVAGDRVVILVGKDLETVVAIYATLRCGAAYVPVDRAAPLARRREIADDVEARACVAPAAQQDEMRAAKRVVLAVESVLQAAPRRAEFPELRHDMLAYVIYTSGSTGRPKGVMITHGNVAALFAAHRACIRLDETSVTLNTTPFHFDGSVGDCLFPLSLGGAVQLGPALPVPSVMLRLMQERRVTHLCIVPSSLARMTDEGARERRFDLSALQTIIFGGEAAELPVLQAWRTAWPQLRLVNGYGPTEATYVCVSRCWEPQDALDTSALPIGRPHAGLRVVLLPADGEPTPAGPHALREGVLALSGAQVSPGYWRRPEEDARAFVEIDGVRFYRTGDLCQFDAAGDLVYRGRADQEAKINGYRIHMAEVQAALLRDPAVTACVAFPLSRPGHPAVLGCAIACARSFGREEVLALARAMRTRLPAYMVPKHFLLMPDGVPLLPSGKVDAREAGRRLLENLSRREDTVFVDQPHLDPICN